MMPQRIQLRRTKGWRKPSGVVVVSRPSKWGNPVRVGDLNPFTSEPIQSRAEAVDVFRRLNGDRPAWILAARRELAGKDLACWCPLEDERGNRVPCHADTLLEIANPSQETQR